MRVNLSRWIFFFILSLFPFAAFSAFDSAKFNSNRQPLSILSVNPSGMDVPPSREIVFRFNRPVVPVGRMERTSAEIPISIVPSLPCEWRWLNTSSLACQLGEKGEMAPATRYTIYVHPGIKAEDGSTLSQTSTYQFVTQRPQVVFYDFKKWTAPGMPVIRLRFNTPVTGDSVAAHLFFQTQDGRRIPLTVSEDPDYQGMNGYRRGGLWLVSPQTVLPADMEVSLRVEKGIMPLQGKEHGGEEREVVRFQTFPDFTFVGVRCQNNDGDSILIRPAQKGPARDFCDPMAPVYLAFSAPVIAEELRKGLKVIPDIAGGRSDYDPWEDAENYSQLSQPHSKGREYTVQLPATLRAYQPYTVQGDPANIRDEFGRPLTGGMRLMFFTDHRKPAFSFDHHFSVLEKGVDTDLPLVVTNLNSVELAYQTLTAGGKSAGHKTLPVAKALDVAYRMPLKAHAMIPGESGIAAGLFRTDPDVSSTEYERTFYVQVTPYNVQVKVGHYNTLVWVTDFATGQPVSGVDVDIYKERFPGLDDSPSALTKGVTDKNGVAVLAGTEKIDPGLAILSPYREYEDDGDLNSTKLFVRCRKGDDIAMVPLIGAFEAEAAGESYVYPGLNRKYGHVHAWGATAQGIYKAGDLIQFKFYVRDQDNRTFVMPPLKGYKLRVIDPMDKVVHEAENVTLSEFGSFAGEFTVPKNGAVGWYRFVLSASFIDRTWEPMRVLVSDFTPSPFKVQVDLSGELVGGGAPVNVITQARLHAGGPYASAGARITAQVHPEPFTTTDPVAAGFWFGAAAEHGYPGPQTVYETEDKVNDKGDLERRFIVNPSDIYYGTLMVEAAVRDDRGKYVAATASAKYVGRDRYVGLRQSDWLLQKDKPARVEALVVNELGKPTSGSRVTIAVEWQKMVASRVKGAGNAYLTHFEYEWVNVKEFSLKSDAAPVSAEFVPENPGYYRITARVEDTGGKVHTTTMTRWAVGSGNVLWATDPGIGLQILPEKPEYRVGEKARYLVKNPFPGAKALVTIERYGVLKSWVQTFADNTPVIEFDVEPDFVPGFYLSVSVMSPRVDKPLGDDQVDLGKPSFRMGYVEVPVRDPYKEISVEVTPERKVYRPREKVTVDIQAHLKQASASDRQPPMELAVVVLDEAVLDLIQGGKSYYDVYKGFYYLDSLDIRNFNLLMRLVGRQKFEKKGANTGGDGGSDLAMRSLFKFVTYWNPSVKTGSDGKARVTFEVPDNLTGWRVLVMAVNAGDRMGLGDASFAVNRPTEIRTALPNQVTSGDTFQAGFTVMNRTAQERTLDVSISAQGPVEAGGGGGVSILQKITAPPFKRAGIWLPLKTNGEGDITFKVTARDALDGDAMTVTMPVRKRFSLETAATYGTTVSDKVQERIAFPNGIRTDVGAVSVTLAPTVIGNVEGAFAYMRDYPYLCWEQKLTKGVMASHYQNLKPYLPTSFAWPESKAVVEQTLQIAAEHQAPNGGICFYTADDSHVSPYLSAYTAISFNWLRKSGYKIPDQVEKRLHTYLLDLLRRDAFPTFYSKGMGSTVRAVALAALAPHGKITKADLERYRRHLPEMSLFGKSHYLLALLQVSGTEEMRQETATAILAHANETGGKFVFSEDLDAGYAQILASTTRDNGAVLSALVAYGETPQGAKLLADVPFKLVRSITQMRGQRDRWENTQDNVFCLNALIDYSRIYEKDKPDFTVNATLDSDPIGTARFHSLTDKLAEVERPLKQTDPGRTATVNIEREGKGRLYYSARLAYAPSVLKTKPINAGIEVHREYSVEQKGKWTLLKSPMQIKQGDLVRVDLYLSLPAPRNFVVVDDAVPGGLEPVNRDLATASVVDAAKGDFKAAAGSWWYRSGDWRGYGISFWSFYHKELRHHAARFYSEYLPAGNYHLSYTAQAIAPGEFTVLPLHAEEMYDPDVFGKSEPAILRVEKKD